MLQPGGFLALETAGGEQAYYIADLLRRMRRGGLADAGWGAQALAHGASVESADAEGEEQLAFADVRVRRDLRGIDRFVTATAAAGQPEAEMAG